VQQLESALRKEEREGSHSAQRQRRVEGQQQLNYVTNRVIYKPIEAAVIQERQLQIHPQPQPVSAYEVR
jgi:hypothetical protein